MSRFFLIKTLNPFPSGDSQEAYQEKGEGNIKNPMRSGSLSG